MLPRGPKAASEISRDADPALLTQELGAVGAIPLHGRAGHHAGRLREGGEGQGRATREIQLPTAQPPPPGTSEQCRIPCKPYTRTLAPVGRTAERRALFERAKAIFEGWA